MDVLFNYFRKNKPKLFECESFTFIMSENVSLETRGNFRMNRMKRDFFLSKTQTLTVMDLRSHLLNRLPAQRGYRADEPVQIPCPKVANRQGRQDGLASLCFAQYKLPFHFLTYF